MRARSYLDHNATSPLRPEARQAIIAALDCIGNPSSIHSEGRAAREIVEDARESVAAIFEVKPSSVYFTSSGTEAANWLLQPRGAETLALATVEHPCVLAGHRFESAKAHLIPVSDGGVLRRDALETVLSPGSIAAVQAANNETGVLQPLGEIGRIAKAKGAALVCDAVQAVGRVPLGDLENCDALFLSAHKFGGPKGAGAAIIRNAGFTPPPLLRGGGQERRQRSGTENVPGIAGRGSGTRSRGFGADRIRHRCKGLATQVGKRCALHRSRRGYFRGGHEPSAEYDVLCDSGQERRTDADCIRPGRRCGEFWLGVLLGQYRALARTRRHGGTPRAERRNPRLGRMDNDRSGYRTVFDRSFENLQQPGRPARDLQRPGSRASCVAFATPRQTP